MEKSRHGAFVYAQKVLKHSLFLFLLINLLSISPDISASTTLLEQKYTLNLSFKDARLEQVLDAIMKQSGVKIAYSSDELQKDQVVSVDIQTSDILTALRSVLGDGYSFKQIEDYIAIARKEISDASDIVSNIADDRNWTIQGQVLENIEPPFPLAGVNIVVKGTTLGTVSDGNGYFSIKAQKGDVLIFRYIGFKDYEYVVSRAISNLTVSLNAESEKLDEIVVTGISEEKKLNSISSVSSLDISKNLSTKPITSLSQSLQGGITGLNVTQNSGLPGADAATIKIRGISSLETNNDPLVLVDGIPMDMNQLDPNTIESVTVLKDAAAAAIYGARAANGVIVVKTKRGMPGKVNVSYNGYFGLQEATYLPEFIDGAGYMEMVNAANKDRSSYYYLGGTAEYTFEKRKHRLFTIAGYNQELTNSGDWDRWSMVSLFAKANYTFDSRYLLEATVRRDGSSRFGKGNKFGVFPSVGAGWNLHEEAFMKPLKDQISEFKVRASYGLLGNENIGLYKYQSLIDAGNGNETVFGNPDITWETVHMLNIGADIRLFKDLSITFDYYDKLTTDMIITPPTSYIGGTSSAPLNSGEVRNRGWELDFTYGKQLTKDFGFSIHGGLSQNKNKIEELFGAPYDHGNRIHQVGYALNSHYVYPTDGLLQENDFVKDASGNLKPKDGVVIFDGQKPGDIHYLDQNGDGRITTDDRVIRGDDQPNLNYFANITLDYKNWNLEVLFQGVQGVDAYYSEPYSFGLNVGGDGQTPLAVQKDYWTPTNTTARYPRMAPNSSYGSNHHTSDFWHFDASYCRVKYIQLGYLFDQMGLKKIGISNIRIYANVQNPFTFAKEKLVDPESRGQRGSYPLVKTYSLGLSLNF